MMNVFDRLHPAFSIRSLGDGDAEAVEALYAAAMSVESSIGPVTAAQWRAFTALPQFGFGLDFRVALDGSRLVGLAESSSRDQGVRWVSFVKIVVHPDVRRRGLGTALLDAVAKADGGSDLQALVPADWTAGTAFLARFGFVRIEAEVTMLCEALKPPSRLGPTGVAYARVADPHASAETIAEIYNAAFARDLSFRVNTVEEMRRTFDGAELWTASLAGQAVAFCLIEPEGRGSWLEMLAVAPRHQGQGIGTALAAQALEAREISSARPCGLSSGNAAAIRIYEGLGFAARSEKGRFAVCREEVLARLRSRP